MPLGTGSSIKKDNKYNIMDFVVDIGEYQKWLVNLPIKKEFELKKNDKIKLIIKKELIK